MTYLQNTIVFGWNWKALFVVYKTLIFLLVSKAPRWAPIM